LVVGTYDEEELFPCFFLFTRGGARAPRQPGSPAEVRPHVFYSGLSDANFWEF
jgi:hypothetical protein